MARTEFISAASLGLNPAGVDEITISFYGPRGGLRAIEGLSIEAARKLHADLGEALARFPDHG